MKARRDLIGGKVRRAVDALGDELDGGTRVDDAVRNVSVQPLAEQPESQLRRRA